MSSRIRLFISNIFVFGLGTILIKFIGFLGLPILTHFIPNPEVFGVFEILITVGALGAAFSNFGINEGIYKVYFEAEGTENRNKVLITALSLGLILALCGGLIVGLIFFFAGGWLTGLHLNLPMAILAAAFSVFFRSRNLFEIPLMIRNSRKQVVLISLLESVCFYGVLILLVGYVWETRIGSFLMPVVRIASLALATFLFFRSGLQSVSFRDIDHSILRDIVRTGLPLSFSSLFYWIITLMDRVLISAYLGTSMLGIYSIGAKAASVGDLVRAAVMKGFPYFAYSTASEPGHEKRIKELVDITLVSSLIVFLIAHFSSQSLFKVLLAPEFLESHRVFSYLLISPLIFIAFQVVCADAIISDHPIYVTISQFAGCIINISLNIILIKKIGIVGGALATLSGFYIMFLCIFSLQLSWKEDHLSKGILLSSILLPLFVLLSLSNMSFPGALMAIVGILYIIIWTFLRRKRISDVWNFFRGSKRAET